MKLFKKIIFFVISIVLISGSYINILGYNLYKEAIIENPLTEKVASIENGRNYITIDKLPQVYLDAVVSVEDHRFYEHGPIDIVSIGRPCNMDKH